MFTPDQAKSISMFLLQGIENEFATTKKVLAAVPDGQLEFKLGDKGRTARDLMTHIIQSDIWFCDGIVAKDFGLNPPEVPSSATVAEMVAHYDKAFPAALAKVKALSGEHLAESVSFFNVMNMPNVVYVSFLNNHMIHHRGQLSTYVRAMNAHVPSIYGGSADEPM